MLITIGFVLKVNPVLALLLLALNLAVIYVIYRLSRGMVPVSEKRAQTMSEANGVLVDSITNAGLVKNFANYRFERRHYFKFMKTAAAADRAETKKFGEIFIWQNLFRALVQVLFYALPSWWRTPLASWNLTSRPHEPFRGSLVWATTSIEEESQSPF